MGNLGALIFIVGCAGAWYFTKKSKDKKKRNYSFLLILAGVVLIMVFSPDSEEKNIAQNSETSATTVETTKATTAKTKATKVKTSATTKTIAEETTTETSDEQIEFTFEEAKIITPSKDQERTMVAFTQLDAEDRGYELTYQGHDAWNIALNYVDGKNKWIITTNDKNFGRVKAVYDWDGKEDSEALLTYLLINGNELLNRLH